MNAIGASGLALFGGIIAAVAFAAGFVAGTRRLLQQNERLTEEAAKKREEISADVKARSDPELNKSLDRWFRD
jgi:nanoRNase/pAp phosphatase (c-di-AMP/oligoRNAs hydrolase)